MPFDWAIFLRILTAILRVLSALPAEADHTAITSATAELVEKANGGGTT